MTIKTITGLYRSVKRHNKLHFSKDAERCVKARSFKEYKDSVWMFETLLTVDSSSIIKKVFTLHRVTLNEDNRYVLSMFCCFDSASERASYLVACS